MAPLARVGLLRGLVLCLSLWTASASVFAEDLFGERIQPFLKTYCYECHSATKPAGELNLTRYESAAMLAEDFRQWSHVDTFVRSGEMPPADAKQPTPVERAAWLKALQEMMSGEARKLAGDPGVVLPRRLSNAEYNYTVRDLTGVDIRPADAFPVDPASGEGFSNTGEALLMSPGLFKKFYSAAQHVADHIDFSPTGWKFAPYPVQTYADQKKLHEQALISFYAQHDVRYADYLSAAWSYRHRPADAQDVRLEQWAESRGLSPKYLCSLYALLDGDAADAKYYARWLRERWHAVPPPHTAGQLAPHEVPTQLQALADDIESLALMLCPPETAPIVSNAGNGPIEHIDRRKKTAAARDSFNTRLLADNRRFHVELRELAKIPTVRVVLQATAVEPGDQPATYVILSNLNFSTANPGNYRPDDDQRNFALLRTLEQHAPQQLARLRAGKHPLGHEVDASAVVLAAGSSIELEIPTAAFPELRAITLYADARLDHEQSKASLIRFTLLNHKSQGESLTDMPFPLVDPQDAVAEELRASCAALCKVFPNRFCYVDDTRGLSAGFHLIEGFFRDDQPLCKHVLSDDQNEQLNRLWSELDFGTQIAEKMLRGFVFFERSERNFMKHADFDTFKEEDPALATDGAVLRLEQVYFQRLGVKGTAGELATHPVHTFFAEIRHGLQQRATQLQQAQPRYLQQLESFAEAAYRRRLTGPERVQLQTFFHKLSQQPEFGIEQAVRASVMRVLVSPHFCYRIDPAPPGDSVQAVGDVALASRLSYFLWSSMPDEELLSLAKLGKLHDESVLRAQTRRMLKDPKISGFALEFFGPWLRYRDFLEQEGVSREVFPRFDNALKQSMFEEPTRVLTQVIQQDRPVTELLSGDVTLVNKRLAEHYGVPFTGAENDWVAVTGLHEQGRSGLLGMAVFLTKNSQPQRTSPVKRGFWVVHHLLGEHIPPPPPDVVALPAKETDTSGKTIRQLLALHTEEGKCARCHLRFDDVGLAMEGFDAIGRTRTHDLAGRPIDNLVRLPSGKEVRGVPEYAQFLAAERIDDFSKTLCQKLVGYALGRSLQLSDQPLLETMQANLKQNDYRLSALFETVVASPQFRNQRCRDFSTAVFRSQSTRGDRR